MNIAIAGLGLIGGSFAKALKQRTAHIVTGTDVSPLVMRQALEEGAIDAECDGFSGVDILLVALYPADAVEFIRQHVAELVPGAIVVDLCGVKRMVCDGVRELFADSGAVFIGGHPMAGRECFGFDNASASLFDGASMILTPDTDTPQDKLVVVEELFRSVGFGHIQLTSAKHHDEVIAYTSQLAHIVSSAYVKSPTAREYMGFSAGSFKDMTRVAKLNEGMWTELFLHNSDFLVDQIGVIIDNLTGFRDAIGQKDATRLCAMLKDGREIKEKLG